MTSVLVYRPVKTIDNPFSEIFVRKAEAYFGLKFRPAGKGPTRGPTRLDAEGFKVSAPEPGERNGFWMTNAFHLRTAWVGNTFLLNDPKEEDFVLASGEHKKVLMMPSELGGYPHAKTDLYEAAILDAHNAYMLVILPAEGKNPGDIAKQLIEDPTMPTASLKRELGYVDLPSFEFQYDANVRAALEEMGVKRVFRDLGSLVKVPNSLITGASQRVEIQVDRSGIRANAGTVVAGVVGGIMGGNIVPFHMQINRPFIFLIRDNYTNALLFAGVVIDPTQH